jgi:hypothetical protein
MHCQSVGTKRRKADALSRLIRRQETLKKGGE